MNHTLEHKRSLLDRRNDSRDHFQAEILTYGDRAKFDKAHVIECSNDGARVVLAQKVSAEDVIGVVVVKGNSRLRTFARVAWTSPLNSVRTVAGLEFLKIDYEMAS